MQHEDALLEEVTWYHGSTEEELNRLGERSRVETDLAMFCTEGDKR